MRPSLRSHCAEALCLLALAACQTTSGSGAAADTSHSPAHSAGATPAQQPNASPHVILSPPGRDPITVSVEVVATPELRQRGLMYRKHLDPDAGMLFLFERAAQQSFWMHNTLIALDIIFIKSDWSVLGIVENATPLTDDSRSVPGASQYVLEVNGGYSRRHGLGPGTTVRYVPSPE